MNESFWGCVILLYTLFFIWQVLIMLRIAGALSARDSEKLQWSAPSLHVIWWTRRGSKKCTFTVMSHWDSGVICYHNMVSPSWLIQQVLLSPILKILFCFSETLVVYTWTQSYNHLNQNYFSIISRKIWKQQKYIILLFKITWILLVLSSYVVFQNGLC